MANQYMSTQDVLNKVFSDADSALNVVDTTLEGALNAAADTVMVDTDRTNDLYFQSITPSGNAVTLTANTESKLNYIDISLAEKMLLIIEAPKAVSDSTITVTPYIAQTSAGDYVAEYKIATKPTCVVTAAGAATQRYAIDLSGICGAVLQVGLTATVTLTGVNAYLWIREV